jgi:hypothetical protein
MNDKPTFPQDTSGYLTVRFYVVVLTVLYIYRVRLITEVSSSDI